MIDLITYTNAFLVMKECISFVFNGIMRSLKSLKTYAYLIVHFMTQTMLIILNLEDVSSLAITACMGTIKRDARNHISKIKVIL